MTKRTPLFQTNVTIIIRTNIKKVFIVKKWNLSKLVNVNIIRSKQANQGNKLSRKRKQELYE